VSERLEVADRPDTSGGPELTIDGHGFARRRDRARRVPARELDAQCLSLYKMVQIRNVPDALHRKSKVRAADAGQTLSDYLLAELERLASRPTRREMLTRIHSRRRVTLKTPAATVIREERESA
jgi:antitoxin FitA